MRTWFGALVIVGCQADTFVAPDASVDAAVVVDAADAGATGDAPNGDAQPGDAGCTGPDFCSTVVGNPPLCADFDKSSSIWMGWNAAPTVSGGFTVDFGYDSYVSCPHSVKMTVAPAKAGTAWLLRDVALTVTGEVVVDVDVRLPINPAGNDFSLFEVRTGPGGTPPSTGLVYSSINGWQVRAGVYSTSVAMPSTPWVHCTLDTTLSATAGIKTIFTVSGKSAVGVADGTALTLGAFVTVAVGVGTTTTAAGPIYYDNVVVQPK